MNVAIDTMCGTKAPFISFGHQTMTLPKSAVSIKHQKNPTFSWKAWAEKARKKRKGQKMRVSFYALTRACGLPPAHFSTRRIRFWCSQNSIFRSFTCIDTATRVPFFFRLKTGQSFIQDVETR